MITFLVLFAIAAGAFVAYQCVYDEEIQAKAYAAKYKRQQRIREKAMQLIEDSPKHHPSRSYKEECHPAIADHRCPTGDYEEGFCPVCPLRDHCYPTTVTSKEADERIEILPSIHSGNEETFLADSPDCCPNCYEDDLCSDHDDGRFFAYASDEAYNEWYGEADAQESRNNEDSLF